MSKRARDVRRLAELLTGKSSTSVRIYYERALRRYRVVWTNGPNVAQMYTLAIECADGTLDVDVAALLWDSVRFPPNGGQVFKQLSLCLSGIARNKQG